MYFDLERRTLPARPAGLEFRRFESRQDVRFSVEHNVGKREEFPRREEEVQVLERLGLYSISIQNAEI